MHTALELTSKIVQLEERLLFPTAKTVEFLEPIFPRNSPITLDRDALFDTKLNAHQIQAVDRLINAPTAQTLPPFIIWGPPGTSPRPILFLSLEYKLFFI